MRISVSYYICIAHVRRYIPVHKIPFPANETFNPYLAVNENPRKYKPRYLISKKTYKEDLRGARPSLPDFLETPRN